MDPHVRSRASQAVCTELLTLLAGFERVAVYAAVRGELSLAQFIRESTASLAFPRAWTDTHRLTFHWSDECPRSAGAYGIAEPSADCPIVAPEAFQAILVPGAAFTPSGDRLGMGGGYYDRYLMKLPPDVLRVGVGYDWLIVGSVFSEAHDITMTHVLTEERTFRAGRSVTRIR